MKRLVVPALLLLLLLLMTLGGCSAGPSASCPDGGCADVSGRDVLADDVSVDVAPGDNGGGDSGRDGLVVVGDVADAAASDVWCADCLDQCDPCSSDVDCSDGLLCWKKDYWFGHCFPPCPDGVCDFSTPSACMEKANGLLVCVPDEINCPLCIEDGLPYEVDGDCVECMDSSDCGNEGECCSTDSHACVMLDCAFGTIFNKELCDCRQCFTDDDCLRFEDATGECLPDGTCEGVMPCGGLCTADFPVCAIVSGVEQCVQCASDEDCAMISSECHCSGDPIYSCVDSTGAICGGCGGCAATCEDSGDCPPTPDDGAQDCIQMPGSSTGYCVDPSGHCDGVASCCAPGQGCIDLVLILQEIYPAVPRLIPQPTVTATFCGCDTADDCLAGGPCTELSILCTSGDFSMEGMYEIICPDGQLHPAFPEKLCIQPATLLEYFGLVPVSSGH